VTTTTSVPAPSFTPQGFVAPPESVILAGVQQDINNAFNGNLNFGTTQGSITNSTPQGQLASSFTALIGIANDTFLFQSTQTDPSYAEGRFQDAIGRIYFQERIASIPTTLQLQCVGAVGTVIPIGSLVVDQGNNLYESLATGTIGNDGTVLLPFAAQLQGFLPVPQSIAIYQAIPGWDTINLISGVAGQNSESRAAFENRRALSTAANSTGSLPSILGAVLGVPGVTQAFVYENTTSAPVFQGGVSLAAKSVYVAAYGGNPADVARAIWSRKAPGCGYGAGNVTVTVLDTSPGYSLPFPSYQVTYQVPNPLQLLFAVQIVNSVGVPADATTQIQAAIINAGAGNPNALNVIDGPQAYIGSKIWASRFVPSISALGTWAEGQVVSLLIGSNNNADAATASGSCGGTSLHVAALFTGSIGVGQTLSFSNGSGTFLPGTTIVSQVSGTVGGNGVYTISVPQTVNGGSSNLLLQSNTFNVTWGQTNATVAANFATSPDGTNDAWSWQRSSGASASANQTVTKAATALTYTLSIHAQSNSGSYLALALSDGLGNDARATFNILTGLVSNPLHVNGSFVGISALIVPAANGFFRCSLTCTTGTGVNLVSLFSGNSNNVDYDGVDTFASTKIAVYGAQLEQASVASPYVTTTAAAVPITNVVIGFATPNQASVQVQINQIPQIAANNIVVSYV
jgi:hypothetical protein